jgi:PIN domain nuclease of toxin-antitoxin system
MNIIIDTPIFLWALSDPSRISDTKRSALEDLSHTVYVSAITIAELMIKTSIGKLAIDFDPVRMAGESGFALLDFSAEAALLLKDMPFHHRDPFDRMLIAQSMAENYPLMTDDPKIMSYRCRVI